VKNKMSEQDADSTATVTYRTSWGDGWIRFDSAGLVEMGLPGQASSGSPPVELPQPVASLITELENYWNGGPLPVVDPVIRGRAATTPLMRSIYDVVCSIPAGSTRTYAEVAAAAGRPGAARSVGSAMAGNPFAPMIPCHRVVGSDGSLRGYGGGLDMKESLLDMERAGA